MAKYVLPLSLVLVVFVAGCTGNDADDAMATAAEVSSARLVGVDEFAERMGEPDVLAVNVHVPDEGQLPGTDLAIRFDEISDSEALLLDASAHDGVSSDLDSERDATQSPGLAPDV
jgi:hypothetical protein